MVDAFAIMKANRAGYEIFWLSKEEGETAWFRKDGEEFGPFKTLDDAAYAAISMDEEKAAQEFWKGRNDEGS